MVEIKHLCLCLLFSSTHFSVYKDTFAFYKDTKCVQGHAILMPAALFNSDEHVRPLTPNRETVKEVLIFRLLSCYDSSVISELKPMDGVHQFKGETKLAISFYFYMLNKSVETHIEQEWTKTIALKYASTDWNKRGLKT